MGNGFTERATGIGLSQQDWSLHRKGPQDAARHNDKVKDAIRQNIPDIISGHDILSSDGKTIIKVPIRNLEEYKFRFGEPPKGGQVGQGQGGTKPGDVIGTSPTSGKGGMPGAGEQPGVDYYEAELTVDELSELVFADLGLPNIQPRKKEMIESESVVFNDIRRRGSRSNIDWKRTARQNIKRNAAKGDPHFGGLIEDDLLYKSWNTVTRPDSNAVLLLMMDASGSMGDTEKYLARSTSWWMLKFLRSRYEKVETVFISHTTEAKKVNEAEFFTKGESGGTKVSSAYALAHEVIDTDFPISQWNVYPFHFSDGDNWSTDNESAKTLVAELLEKGVNQFGYAEVGSRQYRDQGLMNALQSLAKKDSRVVPVTIPNKLGVHSALKMLFKGDVSGEARDGSRV